MAFWSSLSLTRVGGLDSHGRHHDREQGIYHCRAGEAFNSKGAMLQSSTAGHDPRPDGQAAGQDLASDLQRGQAAFLPRLPDPE